MILKEETDIIKLVNEFKEKITEEKLSQYWQGFEKLPFAFYDDKKVYLANHNCPPKDFCQKDKIYIGNWRNEFIGNTSIYFEGEHVGIVNLDYLKLSSPSEKIYSLLIHEMFHAHQRKVNFQPDYNEIMFLKYPFTKENLTLRFMERKELLKAVFAIDKKLKNNAISKFISLREKRKELIGDIIKYELGLESNEGTARYVEFKALSMESELPKEFILSLFGEKLSEYPDDLDGFRHSCYSPGMYICLLLDYFASDWQGQFLKSKKHLYDFFLEKVEFEKLEIDITDFSYAEYLVSKNEEKKRDKFNEFNESDGYKLILKGEMRVTGFNPLNVTAIEDKILHGSFLKIQVGKNDFFINCPVLANHTEEFWNITEAVIFTTKPPVIDGEMIDIESIGLVSARLDKEDEMYYIYLT
ncbi:MAG: hypothetical protein KAX49_18630 [Halanaerobiales bacterium]|nr:hypothetical protein [Halanaerobiales bacterium]